MGNPEVALQEALPLCFGSAQAPNAKDRRTLAYLTRKESGRCESSGDCSKQGRIRTIVHEIRENLLKAVAISNELVSESRINRDHQLDSRLLRLYGVDGRGRALESGALGASRLDTPGSFAPSQRLQLHSTTAVAIAPFRLADDRRRKLET